MEHQKSQKQHTEIPHQVRLRYWLDFARGKHRREMHLLLHEAKLGGKPHKVGNHWEGWNNVIKHQTGEAAAFRVLGHALRLPQEQQERQETFAFIHDAEKRAQIKPGDFAAFVERDGHRISEREALRTSLQPILEETDPARHLRTATNEEFFYELFERTPGNSIDEKIANTQKEELLQYYIDSIFIDGNIVPALERIAKTEERRKDLNDDPERSRRLGMKYWDAERLVAKKVEALMWQWLREQGTDLPSPENVPAFIRQKMEQDMVMHWLEVHGRENIVVDLEEGSGLAVETLCNTKRTQASGALAPEQNEDTGIVRQKGTIILAGVFDGATNIGAKLPLSPGKAAAITCREAVAEAPTNESPVNILLRANRLVRSIAAGLPLTAKEQSEVLCAVGAVARLDTETRKLTIASVADCHIVVLHLDGTHTWLTKNTSVNVERQEIAAAVWETEHPGAALPEESVLLGNLERVMTLPLQQRPVIRPLDDQRVLEVIARNRRLENDPGGRGAPSLKGGSDDALRRFIQEASIPVRKGDDIVLFTDGGYPGPLSTLTQQEEVVHVLRARGIRGLHAWVRQREDADPSLRNPPRMKQYDDLVALRLRVM